MTEARSTEKLSRLTESGIFGSGSQRIWRRFAADLVACVALTTVGSIAGLSGAEMVSTGLPLEMVPEFLNSPLPDFAEPVRILGVSVSHGKALTLGALGGAIAGAGSYLVLRSKLSRRG